MELEAKRLAYGPGCFSPSDGWVLAQCSPMSLRKVAQPEEDRGWREFRSHDSATEQTETIRRAAPGWRVAYGFIRGKLVQCDLPATL